MSVWFISGASRGFGLEIARAALASRHQVVATARKADATREQLPSEGDCLLTGPLDVTDPESIQAAVDRFGRTDVPVNNAGTGLLAAAEESDDAAVRRMYQTKVSSDGGLPAERERRLINISQIAERILAHRRREAPPGPDLSRSGAPGMSGPVEPVNGWHWGTWAAEFGCTAVLMFAVVSAKTAAVTAGAPYSSPRGQNLVIGVTAGLAVMTLAFTAWGRRSGPHLNPAVTLGLWRMRVVSTADLAGYCVAQLAGAMTGVAASRVWGSRVSGPQIDWAVTAPGKSVGSVEAAAIEAAATFVQLLVLFAFLRSKRLSAWTAPVAGGVLTVAIVALGSVSGAAFNPVRGLAFDIVANRYPAVWVFIVGPLLAAVLAPMAVPRWYLLTGKLRHDGRYRCWMRCAIPHVEVPGERDGEDVRSTVLSARDRDSTSPA